MVELGNVDVMALISKATNGIAEGEVQQLTLCKIRPLVRQIT